MPALVCQVSVHLFTPVDSPVPRKVYLSQGQGYGERTFPEHQPLWVSLWRQTKPREVWSVRPRTTPVSGTRVCPLTLVYAKEKLPSEETASQAHFNTYTRLISKLEKRGKEKARLS